MKPPNKKIDYEKIRTDEFVSGIIEDILYEKEHTFKGWKGGPDVVRPAVRLVFTIDGYSFPHKTPWMKFNYSAKSNLFKRFIVPLVQNAEEHMDFDFDQLKGVKVKMLWADNGDFQNIETIRPADGKKIVPIVSDLPPIEKAEVVEDEIPF